MDIEIYPNLPLIASKPYILPLKHHELKHSEKQE